MNWRRGHGKVDTAERLVDDISVETTLTAIRHLTNEIQHQAELVLERASARPIGPSDDSKEGSGE